jgi:hypothetical protein
MNINKQLKYYTIYINIKMIGSLLNTLLYIMLFADVLERRFPNEFKRIMIEITINCIYAFSKLQIYLSQTNTTINRIIDSNPTLSKLKNDVKIFLKQDNSVKKEYIKDGKPIIRTICDDYDFIIITSHNESGSIHKKIIYKGENVDNNLTEESGIKFMLIELQIGEKEVHKIDLKSDKFNYYLAGNKFNKQFFIYYLRQYLNINKEINDADKISLKILDHDVNTVVLELSDKNASLELENNNYKLNTDISINKIISEISEDTKDN